MNEMQSPAESQEPYVMTRIPEQAVSTANCSALRNHFPFMWKICLCYGICYLLFAYNNPAAIAISIINNRRKLCLFTYLVACVWGKSKALSKVFAI